MDGYPIVLTSDLALMSDYSDTTSMGFASAVPDNYMPEGSFRQRAVQMVLLFSGLFIILIYYISNQFREMPIHFPDKFSLPR